MRDYDKAIPDYDKAIKIDPKYAEAYVARGDAYEMTGKYDKVIANFTEAIENDPKFAFYYTRGNAYRVTGEYDKAIADYTKAIEIDPKDAWAYVIRGQTYGRWARCTAKSKRTKARARCTLSEAPRCPCRKGPRLSTVSS